MLLNIQGLVTKRVNKLNSLELSALFGKNDILLFNETWTSEVSEIDVSDYEVISLHRTQKKIGAKRDSGGLAIYIRSSLYDSDVVVKKDSDDVIWIRLKPGTISDKTVFICLCYVLPSGTCREVLVDIPVFDRLLDHIAELENSCPGDCSFIICGDMNARTRDISEMIEVDNSKHIPLPDEYICDNFIKRTSKR